MADWWAFGTDSVQPSDRRKRLFLTTRARGYRGRACIWRDNQRVEQAPMSFGERLKKSRS